MQGSLEKGGGIETRAIARREFDSLIHLALPIIVTQLSQMGMGVADTIMAGQVSATDLAGIAMGGTLFWPIVMVLSGLILAVTPSVSQLHGAGRESEVGEVVRQALWLAAGGSLLGVVLILNADVLLTAVGVDPRAIPVAVAYLDAMSIGLVPLAGYFTLRYLCEGMSWTTPAMLIAVSALLAKIPLNYLFIHGGFGIEARGGAGCGWASAVVMTGELVAMLLVASFSRIRRVGTLARFSPPDPREILRLVKLGAPIAATLFFEVAVFSASALLIGRLGVESIAAHQIAGNINGLTFMIPLALGTAATIRVGFNVGAGDLRRARIAGFVALGSSLLFALAAAAVLIPARHAIASLFTADVTVAVLAAELMLFVAFYQLFDDAQAAAIGALRGYKDTRVPMIVTLVAYWVITLPLGASLGFGLFGLPALGVYGFWWSFTLGLGLVALVLGARLAWLAGRDARVLEFARR
jgi:MATE family multidrug resistance protein